MHGDKKLGLALGILLIGVVGAFFFRNEPDPLADLPVLEDAAMLDEQIAEKPIGPYLTSPELEEATEDVPQFPQDTSGAQGAILGGPPEPIITRSNDLVGAAAVPIPEHNRAWTVASPEPAPSQPEAASIGQPRTHRVQHGETLSGLAQRYLGSSTRYLEIYAANQDVLRNPNDLRVGMTIRIPSPEREPATRARSAGPNREHIAQPISATQAHPGASSEPAAQPNNPPQANAPPAETPRRFVPARRPLWPVRRPATESSQIDDAPGRIRSLTQIPPRDLTIDAPGR